MVKTKSAPGDRRQTPQPTVMSWRSVLMALPMALIIWGVIIVLGAWALPPRQPEILPPGTPAQNSDGIPLHGQPDG